MSTEKLFAMNTFCIADLKIMYQADTPLLLMKMLLNSLNKALNFKDEQKLQALTIDVLSHTFCEWFGGLTLGELWFFFDNLIKGKYGAFYGQMDSMLFAGFFEQFREQRIKILRDSKYIWKVKEEQAASSRSFNPKQIAIE